MVEEAFVFMDTQNVMENELEERAERGKEKEKDNEAVVAGSGPFSNLIFTNWSLMLKLVNGQTCLDEFLLRIKNN